LGRVGDVLAIATAELLATERRWIHRRVEKFEFHDARRFRRAMTIDFTLPSGFPRVADQPSTFVVPLALPRKIPLRDLDICGESGNHLPLLTRDENASISSAMLRILSEQALIETKQFATLDSEVALDLADIAGARYGPDDRPSEEDRLRRVQHAVGRFRIAQSKTAPASVGELQRSLLWGHPVLRPLIDLIRERFIFFVRLHAEPDDRRLVKMSYEFRVQQGTTSSPGLLGELRLWRREFALKRYVYNIQTRGIYAAASYHAEAVVPDELVIRRADLSHVVKYVDSRSGKVAPDQSVTMLLDSETDRVRAHLLTAGVDPTMGVEPPPPNHESAATGFVDLELQLRMSVIFAPFVVAVLTAMTLTAGLVLRGLFHDHADSASGAATLVAVPGLFAAFFVPGEHPLVRRIFLGLRALTMVVLFDAVVAAAALAVTWSTSAKALTWAVLCGLTWVVAGVMCRAFLVAVPRW
jgi:hypothetical protein